MPSILYESNDETDSGKLETNSGNIHPDNIIIPKHNKTNLNPYEVHTGSFCPRFSFYMGRAYHLKPSKISVFSLIGKKCSITIYRPERQQHVSSHNNSCLSHSACLPCRRTLCPQTPLSESITHTPQVTEQFITVQLPVNVQ